MLKGRAFFGFSLWYWAVCCRWSAARRATAKRAGEKVDKAAQDMRDTVNPPSGPVEAAGRKMTTQRAGLRDGWGIGGVPPPMERLGRQPPASRQCYLRCEHR